jgi:16S rRNA processing protein RimM
VSAAAGDKKASEERPVAQDGALRARAGAKRTGESDSRAVPAGRVGRAHGLDGSFYVTGARARLLTVGAALALDGQSVTIVRRAGTDEHPIVRLQEIADRHAAEALRGSELTVQLSAAPSLEEGEWWAQELEGCEVVDGQRHVGTVTGLLELPSCEALEVRLGVAGESTDTADGEAAGGSSELLVPMVRDAIRFIDPQARRIDVDMAFLGAD